MVLVFQRKTLISELHALLSDHDYMLGKTCTPIAPYGPQTLYGVRHQTTTGVTITTTVAIATTLVVTRCHDNGRQFDWASTQNTVYDTCNRCDTGANSHVTPDLEAMV
nr:hypothetical protein [Tanacetum cinerariifolium]